MSSRSPSARACAASASAMPVAAKSSASGRRGRSIPERAAVTENVPSSAPEPPLGHDDVPGGQLRLDLRCPGGSAHRRIENQPADRRIAGAGRRAVGRKRTNAERKVEIARRVDLAREAEPRRPRRHVEAAHSERPVVAHQEVAAEIGAAREDGADQRRQQGRNPRAQREQDAPARRLAVDGGAALRADIGAGFEIEAGGPAVERARVHQPEGGWAAFPADWPAATGGRRRARRD